MRLDGCCGLLAQMVEFGFFSACLFAGAALLCPAGGPSNKNADKQARDMALVVKSSGLDGVVCSPLDIANIKKVTGPDFLTIVPGIRPSDSAAGDQKRIATPQAALAQGADILVIGRPVTGAADPVAAAHAILESLHGH